MPVKGSQISTYRDISPLETFLGHFAIHSSTGGCETSIFDQYEKHRLFYKASISPVILLKNEKDAESADSSQETEHKLLP
jgi:hypothetical protein